MPTNPFVSTLLALAVSAGVATGAPCLLDPKDQPLNCPGAGLPAPMKIQPARKAAGQVEPKPPAPPVCQNPKTKAPMKCPPAVLAPGV